MVLLARNKKQLQQIAKQCEQYHAQVLVLPTDMGNIQSIKQAFAQCMKMFGKLNVLVLNQGIGGFSKNFVDDEEDIWEKIIDINLKASMAMTKMALPVLIETSKKHINSCAIIFMASVSSKSASAKFAAYCASKFGLYGFAQAIFNEVREYGIKVSSICPSWVNTDMAVNSGYNLDPKKMI